MIILRKVCPFICLPFAFICSNSILLHFKLNNRRDFICLVETIKQERVRQIHLFNRDLRNNCYTIHQCTLQLNWNQQNNHPFQKAVKSFYSSACHNSLLLKRHVLIVQTLTVSILYVCRVTCFQALAAIMINSFHRLFPWIHFLV